MDKYTPTTQKKKLPYMTPSSIRCHIRAHLTDIRPSNNPYYHHMDIIPTSGPIAGKPVVLGLSRNLIYYIQSNIASGAITKNSNIGIFGTYIPSISDNDTFVAEHIDIRQ